MLEKFYYLIGHGTEPVSWWQMCIRTTIIFSWALVLYRVVPRRAFGSSATVDIVLVVIMGSTLSRALTGSAPLLPVIAATALLALLYSITILTASRIDLVGRILKGRSILLIKDGEIDRDALRLAHLGEGDLRESLRQQGTVDLDKVAEAHLERNGEISIIERD